MRGMEITQHGHRSSYHRDLLFRRRLRPQILGGMQVSPKSPNSERSDHWCLGFLPHFMQAFTKAEHQAVMWSGRSRKEECCARLKKCLNFSSFPGLRDCFLVFTSTFTCKCHPA